jgi:hypothetical protein
MSARTLAASPLIKALIDIPRKAELATSGLVVGRLTLRDLHR